MENTKNIIELNIASKKALEAGSMSATVIDILASSAAKDETQVVFKEIKDYEAFCGYAEKVSVLAKRVGTGFNAWHAYLTYKDDSISTTEKTVGIAADVGMSILTWTKSETATITGLVLTVAMASERIMSAQIEFSNSIIDGISNFANLFEVVEKSTENIYNGCDDGMKVTTYEIKLSESGAELWNNFTETLTNIFQAQVEMEMAFEGYLPKNLDTTNVYAKGITSQCDPIVLDLNGDGVTTTYVKENYVNFDLDANGFAERTGWINAQDGFLVRDINGNGKIDDGAEMFGDHTMLQNGKTASNSYEALKELDTNYDGKIDSKDTAYNELKIWKDSNSNGVTDNGELYTLAELGIESINTNYTYKNTKDENTNTVYGTGTYTKTDGTTGKTADLFFDVDKVNTTADESDVMYSEEILDLPDLKGYGTTHGLHYAMAKDGTGELTALVLPVRRGGKNARHF